MDESVHALREGTGEGCDDRPRAVHLSEAAEAADGREANRLATLDQL